MRLWEDLCSHGRTFNVIGASIRSLGASMRSLGASMRLPRAFRRSIFDFAYNLAIDLTPLFKWKILSHIEMYVFLYF